MVARLGAHLLTGGGYGVMEAVAEGFVSVADRAGCIDRHRAAQVATVAFDEPNRDREGRPYPNAFVEIADHDPAAAARKRLAQRAGAQPHQRVHAPTPSSPCRAMPARATSST